MAISRHKVLSEMQQQLELASSKCGNLQKQLEIVKDRVRQSSTTNLARMELPENKENKTKTLEPLGTTDNRDYSQALSTTSSSSEEANEERDVNIIKVFYDRLGQMDYPKGQVELSDISSEDNDLDIDQLLSSVNFSVRSNEERIDSKGKKVTKKGKAKIDKTKNQKRKTSKGKVVKSVSPYESTLPKLFKQTPVKNKKARPLKPSNSLSHSAANVGNKPASRGPTTKAEADKMRKKKVPSSGLPVAKNNKKIFQEPIKRVMNLATQLRKSKSSTNAEKREIFTDTRSLTRLHSDSPPVAPPPPVEPATKTSEEQRNHEKDVEEPKNKLVEERKSLEKIEMAIPKIKPGTIQRPKIIRNVNQVSNRVNDVKVQKGGSEEKKVSQHNKGTSLSDLVARTNQAKVQTPNKSVPYSTGSLKSIETAPSAQLAASQRTDFKSRRSLEVKAPSFIRKGQEVKPQPIRKPLLVKVEGVIAKVEAGDEPNKSNGIVPHTGKSKMEVKRRIDMFEKAATKEKETLDVIKHVDKGRSTSKLQGNTITRASSSNYDDISRRGIESLRGSSVNTAPPPPALRGAGDMADNKTLTISQIKKMKDNLMKFNAIPFIVGQSTSKSYHIGLNIQETYSLFKQTPSMTALMSKNATHSPDHHLADSRARSIRTGYSGRRSVSSSAGRETCPACDPVPERSPEQLADPWAVPQDEDAVVRVCTCLPKRMISFDQVLNQLYMSNMNLVKLHPSFFPKDGIVEQSEAPDQKERPAHRPPNSLYYTKLLRSIQNLKDNIMG